jgi:hypothetical protein
MADDIGWFSVSATAKAEVMGQQRRKELLNKDFSCLTFETCVFDLFADLKILYGP